MKAVPWWNKELATLRKESRDARISDGWERSGEAWQNYKKIRNTYNNKVRDAKRDSWLNLCEAIEKLPTVARVSKCFKHVGPRQPNIIQVPGMDDLVDPRAAADWWSFHSKSLLPELDAESATLKYRAFCNSLKEVFPEDDRKKAKLLNKTRVFRVGKDDPLDYVMAKLHLFDRIDSNMEKSKQLHYLFKGLPAQLAHTVHRNLGNDACVNDFIKELKYQCDDPHFQLFTSSTQNPEVPSELYDPDYNPPNPPKPQSTRNFNYPNEYPFNGEIKQQMCGYCNRPGHHIRQCYIFNRHYVARNNSENPQHPPNSSQNPPTAPPQNSQNTPMRPNNGGRPFTRSQNTPDNRRNIPPTNNNTPTSLMHVDVSLPPNHVNGNHVSGDAPRSGNLNDVTVSPVVRSFDIFGKLQHSSNGLMIPIELEKIHTQALIDSGAASTDSPRVPVNKLIHLNVKIATYSTTWQFYIFPQCSQDIILGVDLLHLENLIIDFEISNMDWLDVSFDEPLSPITQDEEDLLKEFDFGLLGEPTEWNFQQLFLNFDILRGSHKGKNLAQFLHYVLCDFDITGGLLSMTSDNTSNMKTVFAELVNYKTRLSR
ncbi:unnamed protein product [Allacma fusca]|uniref:Uncharacterized protein n=1 Tax=Allacma fusca TaxID=39272 RepID=A0A8J2NTX4_9HEXA|nr:unnamed protein product [Allacma fusca]